MIDSEKTNPPTEQTPILPFERYLQSITDERSRKRFILQIMIAIDVMSEQTMWRYRKGLVKPDMLACGVIAKMIREHSGDAHWTGDNLFPAEFYNK